MKENKQTAAILGGLLLVATVIAVGVFLMSGSQGVSWFILIGIPLIVVSGVGLYVKGVTSQSSTTTQEYTQTTGQSTAEEFQEFLRQYHDLNNRYPKWNPQLSSKIESIRSEFQNEGIQFDTNAGSYQLNDVDQASIQQFDKISNEISQAQDQLKSEFTQFTQAEIDQLEQSLDRLGVADLIRRPPTFDIETKTSLETVSSELDEARTEATGVIEDAIESVREMGRGDTRASDTQAIEQDLQRAETAASRYEYKTSVDAVLEAQDKLRQQLSGSFEAQYSEVERLISSFDEIEINSYIDSDTVSELERCKSTLDELNDALDLAELTRLRSNVRRTCTDMIAQMQNRLVNHVNTLAQADVPENYYREPDLINKDPVQKLENMDQLEEYVSEWQSTARQLRDYNSVLGTKAAVVDAYPDVVDQIEQALTTEGKVTADDIPMKNTSEFLSLYAVKNENVEYDSDRQILHHGDIETYNLAVRVSYENALAEPQQTTLELDDGQFSATAIVEDHETTKIEFEDVPEGQHVIAGVPQNNDYQTVTKEISVTADHVYSLEIPEQELIEKVCEGVDIDVEEILPDIRSRIETKFEENGYVTSSMDLPIADQYVPCILATWCEKQGYSTCENSGEIICYNHSKFENQIEKTVKFNLDSGDSITYKELKEKFISPPLPKHIIQESIESINTEKELSADETKIKVIN